MIRKLTSLILLLIPIAVFAQEDERQLVTLSQVKSGTARALAILWVYSAVRLWMTTMPARP